MINDWKSFTGLTRVYESQMALKMSVSPERIYRLKDSGFTKR
jgi:hypothetical protein